MIFHEEECFRNKYISVNLHIAFSGISPEINYIDNLFLFALFLNSSKIGDVFLEC